MTGLLKRLLLYFHTVRWLKISQLLWFAYRRIRSVVSVAAIPAESTRGQISVVPFLSGSEPHKCELRFLNIAATAVPEQIDWHPSDKSRLWRYNLHYFDYLQWNIIPDAYKQAYIDKWIAENPQGTVDAWEPYTVSLRIVNWVKYFSRLAEIPEAWQASLINQANWLQHNLEHHILANHYYKNAKALVFAGVWFSGETGQAILERGLQLFCEQIREQVLGDGGHYERSPMYHCIALEDCLDVLNLMQSQTELFSQSRQSSLRGAAASMLRFIDDVRGADGKIALFNDSAFGIAPEPDELLAYGNKLTGYEKLALPRQPATLRYPDSGYYGYRYGADSLIIDCGCIGPDYQPGHAHCDTLSFELCIDGRRVIVDSGTYGYEADENRQYLRSTAAHNTVTVDGMEQSEIWGTFRVARRARPVRPEISPFEDGVQVFRGGHDGFKRLPQRALHQREITSELAGRWHVSDRIEGQGDCVVRSYLHIAPEMKLTRVEQGYDISLGEQTLARILPDDRCEVEIISCCVARYFGIKENSTALLMLRRGKLPLCLDYRIERVAEGAG